jgi:putative transposase
MMLNDRELSALCDRLGVTPEGQQCVKNIRRSGPARRVQSGTRSVATRFASHKMGFTIQAESHDNELPAVVLWEYDPKTYEIYCQPPKVNVAQLSAAGRQVTILRTFDYFLIQDDFIGWVECKVEDWLQEPRNQGKGFFVAGPNGTWRCPPGETFAKQFGLGFKVRSSKETNPVFLRNIQYLAAYFDEECPSPDPVLAKPFLDRFRDKTHLRLRDLVEDGELTQHTDVLNKLIADRVLFVDLGRQLLTNREETLVFRNEQIGQTILDRLIAPRAPSSLDALRMVCVEAGESVLWDGKPWTIANVGETHVYLNSRDGKSTSVPTNRFTEMLQDGAICAALYEANEKEKRVQELYLQASEEDLRLADWRLRHLSGNTVEGDEPADERSLQKWRRWQKKGLALYGNSYDGLVRSVARRGNRERRYDPLVLKFLDEATENWRTSQDSKSKKAAWGELRLKCEEAGLAYPSERGFRRAIRKFSEYSVKAAQEGEKAAYSLLPYETLGQLTPRHGERAFQIAHIDHTSLDVQLLGHKFGERLSKAWLTLLIDAYTRKNLAFWLCFDAPSYRSSMVVMRECIAQHGRIPEIVVCDSGSDFESQYFETLLARFGASKKTRKKSKPRDGTLVERVFGVTNEEFAHCLRGNNTPLQSPRSMSKTHDPRERAIWNLRDLTTALNNYIENVYHENEHPALGVSPNEAMRFSLQTGGLREHKRIAFTESVRILCLPTVTGDTRKVRPGRGVRIHQYDYWCDMFSDGRWENRDVEVRYDPFNLACAYAYLGRWVKLSCIEVGIELEGISEKEIEARSKEIVGKQKRGDQRREDNARRLALNMREIRETESVLLQQKRDAERKAAEHAEELALPSPNPAARSAKIFDFGALQPKITRRGEFK